MKGTVAFCPMLAILFVGTRMRALLITNNKGAPQGWVQDGMYMATWAVLIQFLFGLIVPLCTGQETPCDEDGNVNKLFNIKELDLGSNSLNHPGGQLQMDHDEKRDGPQQAEGQVKPIAESLAGN